MSLQEMPAFENGLGFMGLFKLCEFPDKIKVYLEGSFSEIFIDPWNNWDKIRRVFGSFGTYKSQENASFSKYEDQGDSQKMQYFMAYHTDGVLVQMYEIANKLGILIDPDDCKITYSVPPTPQETENLTKWKSLAMQFEKIMDIQTSLMVSAFAIGPLINQKINPYSTDIWMRSPAQMKLYNSYLMKSSITLSQQYGGVPTQSCVHRVPWETTRGIFSSLVGTLTGDWWYNLIAEPVINVDYEMVEAPLYTITPGNISDNYFEFSNGGDFVVNIEYAIPLPEDSTADVGLDVKTCFGVSFGQSLLFPCDVCKYAEDCRDAIYINPSLIDYEIRNRIKWGSSSYAGQRVRIKYKKVFII